MATFFKQNPSRQSNMDPHEAPLVKAMMGPRPEMDL